MITAPGDQDRIAAAERHLREGEASLARLEKTVAELARTDPAAAAVLAAKALVPLQHFVDLVRDRLAAVRRCIAAVEGGDDAQL